jgi:Cyclin-dependent kinase inhibitor 3 (CDKN3)
MIEPFTIAEVSLPGRGAIGLCRMPGRGGALADDLAAIAAWSPRVVVSLAQAGELAAHGALTLGEALGAWDIAHRHFPIVDYGAPDAAAEWAGLAAALHGALDDGQRVLVHCMGGCGRSGMVALRLMVERGEAPQAALERLRIARPCAVETDGQLAWASAPHHQPAVRPK